MPTLKTQLSQRNNSSVKPFWSTQAPANRSTSSAARLTEVRGLQGLWNDNKEKLGMRSQVMGLWVCNAACKWNYPISKSQEVCSTVLQKFRACYQLGQQERNASVKARDRCCLKVFSLHSHYQVSKLFSKAVLGHKAWLGHSQLEVATEASGLQ